MTQFFLVPKSMNLALRVHIDDPIVPEIFKLTHNLCFAIFKRRSKMLNEMKTKKESEIIHEKSLNEIPLLLSTLPQLACVVNCFLHYIEFGINKVVKKIKPDALMNFCRVCPTFGQNLNGCLK